MIRVTYKASNRKEQYANYKCSREHGRIMGKPQETGSEF